MWVRRACLGGIALALVGTSRLRRTRSSRRRDRARVRQHVRPFLPHAVACVRRLSPMDLAAGRRWRSSLRLQLHRCEHQSARQPARAGPVSALAAVSRQLDSRGAAFQDATCANRQRHAREHVSNVQRGGATVTGRPMKPNKPQNSLSQSRFSPICCGRWLKIALVKGQVKRKSAQRKQH